MSVRLMLEDHSTVRQIIRQRSKHRKTCYALKNTEMFWRQTNADTVKPARSLTQYQIMRKTQIVQVSFGARSDSGGHWVRPRKTA